VDAYTLDTASKGPLTFRIRSGFPGILSETMTLAPLFSRISLTCAPPLPMMMEASWVTIRQRICILAAGAAALDPDAELLGAADVVADESPSTSPGASPALAAFSDAWEGDGVEAAVSSAGRASMPTAEDVAAEV
jgi:hypothetical protein